MTKRLRILVFNAVGIVGFLVQTGALWLLVSAGNIPYIPATALAVETAIVHNFICHWCWTWKDRDVGRREFVVRLLLFNASNGAVSLAVNVGTMALLQGVLGLHYLLANVVGVACGSAINFVLGDRVVFAVRDDEKKPWRYRSNTRATSSRSAGSSGVHPAWPSI